MARTCAKLASREETRHAGSLSAPRVPSDDFRQRLRCRPLDYPKRNGNKRARPGGMRNSA